MINFRFHLASLIAIFLALALGVVVGAGVIDRGVVDTLNSRLDKVERESDRIRGENNDLRGENGSLADFIDKSQCYAVEGRLATDDVAVVAVRGIDGDSVKRSTDAVKCAGGRVNGVLWLEDKWKLTDGKKNGAGVGDDSSRRWPTRSGRRRDVPRGCARRRGSNLPRACAARRSSPTAPRTSSHACRTPAS